MLEMLGPGKPGRNEGGRQLSRPLPDLPGVARTDFSLDACEVMVFRLHDLDPAARPDLAAAANRLGANDLPLLSHLFGLFFLRFRPDRLTKRANQNRR
jgi:hypothetical protein